MQRKLRISSEGGRAPFGQATGRELFYRQNDALMAAGSGNQSLGQCPCFTGPV